MRPARSAAETQKVKIGWLIYMTEVKIVSDEWWGQPMSLPLCRIIIGYIEIEDMFGDVEVPYPDDFMLWLFGEIGISDRKLRNTIIQLSIVGTGESVSSHLLMTYPTSKQDVLPDTFSLACRYLPVDTVRRLVEKLHITPKDMRSPIPYCVHAACTGGNLPVVQYLAGKLKHLGEYVSRDPKATIDEACRSGNIHLVKFLCERHGARRFLGGSVAATCATVRYSGDAKCGDAKCDDSVFRYVLDATYRDDWLNVRDVAHIGPLLGDVIDEKKITLGYLPYMDKWFSEIIKSGLTSQLDFLLRKMGADKTWRAQRYMASVRYAASQGHVDMIRYLRDNCGLSFDDFNASGKIYYGFHQLVQLVCSEFKVTREMIMREPHIFLRCICLAEKDTGIRYLCDELGIKHGDVLSNIGVPRMSSSVRLYITGEADSLRSSASPAPP